MGLMNAYKGIVQAVLLLCAGRLIVSDAKACNAESLCSFIFMYWGSFLSLFFLPLVVYLDI
jgi:hypothetical protein